MENKKIESSSISVEISNASLKKKLISWMRRKNVSNLEICSKNYEVYCDIMKYPIILMRIFGLYHKKKDNWYLKGYSLFIIIILWFSFARFFSLFDFWHGKYESLSAQLVYKIIIILWSFANVMNGTLFFINQEKNSRENQLIIDISFYLHKYSNKKLKLLKNKIFIYFLIGFFGSGFNSISGIISLFGPDYFYEAFFSFLAPFHKAKWSKHNIPFKIFNNILLSYTSFFWMITICNYLAHCEMIAFIFKNFNQEFRNLVDNKLLVSQKIIENNSYEFEEKFDKLRKKHLKICNIIRQMNKCYKEFIGITLLIYIAIVLLIVYIMSDWNGNCINGIMAILYPYWVASGLIIIILTVVFGSKIHELSSNILDDLLEVNMNNFNNSLCFKVRIFYIFKPKLKIT